MKPDTRREYDALLTELIIENGGSLPTAWTGEGDDRKMADFWAVHKHMATCVWDTSAATVERDVSWTREGDTFHEATEYQGGMALNNVACQCGYLHDVYLLWEITSPSEAIHIVLERLYEKLSQR